MEAIEFCKEWLPQRKWLLKNKINLDNFKEEELYQDQLQMTDILRKAREQKLSRAIDRSLVRRTNDNFEKLNLEQEIKAELNDKVKQWALGDK